ncbi:hypothetical protein pb186bvf_002432 [Paramecium bursaria]
MENSFMTTLRDNRLSIADVLQLRNVEYTDMSSPVQEVTCSNINNLKQMKREESEASFKNLEIDPYERNISSMQNKIQLLISENQKLIEINTGLMREIDIMKSTISNRKSEQVQIQNYQQKLLQLTKANEQLSERLISGDQSSKRDIDKKLYQLLQENQTLNHIVQQRLNEVQSLAVALSDKTKENELLSEQIKTLNEKCEVIEQQKLVLIHQASQYNDNMQQMQIKEQQLIKTIYDEQIQYQTCIKNLEQNYTLQIQEFHLNFQKELQNQIQQNNHNYESQLRKTQEQYKLLQKEYNSVKVELQERSNIWSQEKERYEELIKQPKNKTQNDTVTFRQNSVEHTQESFADFLLEDKQKQQYPSASTYLQEFKGGKINQFRSTTEQTQFEYQRPPTIYGKTYKVPNLQTFQKTDNLQTIRDQQRSYSQYLSRDDRHVVLQSNSQYNQLILNNCKSIRKI